MKIYKGQESAWGFYISFTNKIAILTFGYRRINLWVGNG